ncbi:MAG: radical SAM protein, partial [Candidatus Lokiarchaeota archaeon]|nr:radical SAM protein [Candidatus Lokiarchaeota archaeon]
AAVAAAVAAAGAVGAGVDAMAACNPVCSTCSPEEGLDGAMARASAPIRSGAFHARDIFYLQLHLTSRCNLRCKHCYIEGTIKDRVDPAAELRPAEVLGIINQFDALVHYVGFRGKIYFTGGEPLLDGHLHGYVAEASRRGLIPMILSNGTLIGRDQARSLRSAGARIVQVSIDGMEETHEYVRGRGTFALATRALDECHDAGLATIAMVTLSKLNAREVPRIIGHCLDHHVTSFAIGRLVPVGTGTQLWNQMLTPRELKGTFGAIAGMRKACRGRMEIGIHDPLWLAYVGAKGVRGCTVGKSGLCVIENGDIMPCRRIDVAIGNVRETSLLDSWFSSAMNAYRADDRFHGKCGRCKRNSTCGGCRAVARAVTGDPFGGDPQCFRK